MKKIMPLVFIILIGCAVTADIPPAPSPDEADLECTMRCQEFHAICTAGVPSVGRLSKANHYSRCNKALENCYDLCRQAH